MLSIKLHFLFQSNLTFGLFGKKHRDSDTRDHWHAINYAIPASDAMPASDAKFEY